MDNGVNDLHKVLREILAEVDRVCEENNLNYYMIGGTFLGAIRHKDIIPWDIDVDIALFREDYDKLVAILKTYKPNEYELKVTTDKNHYSPHAVLFLNNTCMEFNTKRLGKKVKKRAFIDFLPLDTVPNNQDVYKSQTKAILKIKNRLYLKQAKTDRKSFLEGVLVYFRSLLYLFPTRKKLQMDLDKLMRIGNLDDSNLCCSYASHYDYKRLTFDKSCFGKPIRYTFGEYSFMGPEKADKYLSQMFGDYMKFPSKESQNDYLNSLVSFKDYRK